MPPAGAAARALAAADLHVESHGAGRPLVLVHGWSFSTLAMAPLADALAGDARVVAVDLPGHGGSPRSAADVESAAAALARTLERHAPDGAVLAGWSWGAEVALATAALHAPPLAALVLLAPTPCFCADDGWPGTPEAHVRALSRRLARDPADTRRLFADGMLAPGESRPALLDALVALPLDVQAARETLEALARADLRAVVDAVRVPTLLLHGSADPVVPPAASAWLAEHLPGARRVVLDGAGHAPHLTRTAEVAELLRPLLAR